MSETAEPRRVKVIVIADDLTGAAELAGAALAHRLSAEVVTGDYRQSLARVRSDVVCIDTDSRSLDPGEAADAAAEATRSALGVFPCDGSEPPWIFKKCDSVLRGNVLAEVEAIRTAGEFGSAVLVPANPGKGRCVRAGRYFIGGVPLDETAFRHDPEYPRLTSEVAGLLGGDPPGISVPDAQSTGDVETIAMSCSPQQLAAGAVEFFEALLRHRLGAVRDTTTEEEGGAAARPAPGTGEWRPSLFVCGSAAAWATGRQQQCEAAGGHVTTMPASLAVAHPAPAAIRAWGDQIARHLASGTTVMAAIGEPEAMARDDRPPPAALATNLAAACAWAIRHTPRPDLRAICAEGGATAAALARAAGWHQFTTWRALGPGAVELEPVPDPTGSQARGKAPPLVVKVGSYPWPDGVW